MQPTSDSSGIGFQAHIEGIRAVAVVAVVAHHLGWLPAGFLGVDAFFVVSGFLITSLLRADLIATGRIRFAHFYARRARRILPMAGLVVISSLALAALLPNPIRNRGFAIEGVWAALFGANFHYLNLQTDYFNSDQPLLLRNYWSLAVEEQFYLIWPVLIALLAALTWRRGRNWLALITATATGLLWWYAFGLGAANPTAAYFNTASRAWELGVGASLALLIERHRIRPGANRLATMMLGLLVVGLCIPLGTSNPALQAVIVVPATAGLIWFGFDVRVPWLTHGWIQRIGSRSYGWYLWHWPLIVLSQLLSQPDSILLKFGAAGAAYLLAELSYRYFENPIRQSQTLRSNPKLALATGSSLVALAAGGSLFMSQSFAVPLDSTSANRPSSSASATTSPATGQQSPQSQEPALPSASESGSVTRPAPKVQGLAGDLSGSDYQTLLSGLQKVVREAVAADQFPTQLIPRLGDIVRDRSEFFDNGCAVDFSSVDVPECSGGDTEAARTLVIYGDSHAVMWMPALDRIGKAAGWRVELFAKLACPLVREPVWSYQLNKPFDECQTWQAKVLPRIAAIHPQLLVVTDQWKPAVRDGQIYDAGVVPLWKRAFPAALAELKGYTDRLVVLGNLPNMTTDAAMCIGERDSAPWDCTALRDEAENAAINRIEQNAVRAIGGSFVDVMSWACTVQFCPTVIGGRVAYFDRWHFTDTYVSWLQPLLQAALKL